MGMSREAIQRYNAMHGVMKEVRQTYEDTWDRIMDHIAPDLKGYLNIERKDDGQRNDDLIYDGSPVEYGQKCAAGMWAAISSPSRPWMRRKMRSKAFDEVQSAKMWTDAVTDMDYDIMQESNFYKAIYAAYYQLETIGTTCVIGDPDHDNVVHFTTLNVGEYWLGTDAKGNVNMVLRELEFRASKLVELFGDKVPHTVKASITDSNPYGNKYKVIHVIGPDDLKLAPFKKPWVSLYYLKDENNDEFLQVRGYNRKPFAATRWYVNSGETYGKQQPGRNALGNCMQLQTMVYDFHAALQKVIDPPLQADQSILENNQVSTVPGTLNLINSANQDATIKALYAINPDLATMWQAIQDKKEQIASNFFIDLFMAVSMRMDKDMTAEEVRSIASERMLALGPGLDNIHEFLNDLLDIIFGYAIDAGLYPEPPEEIQGEYTKVNYISVLAQAQKMVDLGRVDQLLAYAERMLQHEPNVRHKVDFLEMLDEVAKMTMSPAKTIRSDEDVQERIAQEAQQQQAAQMAEYASVAADVGGKMANMPMDQNTALTQFLGVS